jgi:hypothetical protein
MVNKQEMFKGSKEVMRIMNTNQTIFITKVRTTAGVQAAHLLIKSIQAFGGEMSRCPFWVFAVNPKETPCQELEGGRVHVIPIEVPELAWNYDLGDKVYACAKAEEMAPENIQSLIWIDPLCLVVNPPLLYALDGLVDAAFRPVHIRNVGLRKSDPVDAYWRTIYQSVGVEDIEPVVESYVDQENIRAYYNTHAFAINPALGLLRRWYEYFDRLVTDQEFQSGACQDELHKVFLHQAVLSALIATRLAPDRIRILPTTYNYPYNLHSSVPLEWRAKALNDLVSFTYEDRSIDLSSIEDIKVHDPLRAWLTRHVE